MENIYSDFLRLGKSDFVKGLLIAVLSAVLVAVQQGLSTGIDWTQMWHIALTAGIAYLIKNLLTTSDGKFAGVL